MAVFSFDDIMNMDKMFRLNFINSIPGYKSANLIGTVDHDGNENLAVFSTVTHLGSKPPYLGFVTRPTTVPRHTFTNILEQKVYTINQINEKYIENAHHTSAKYPREISEFDKSDLTPEYVNEFKAPFVKESFVKIGMELSEVIDIKSNDTKLVVGKIVQIILPDDALDDDGSVNHEILKTVTISGLDTYLSVKKIKKFEYQRPIN